MKRHTVTLEEALVPSLICRARAPGKGRACPLCAIERWTAPTMTSITIGYDGTEPPTESPQG